MSFSNDTFAKSAALTQAADSKDKMMVQNFTPEQSATQTKGRGASIQYFLFKQLPHRLTVVGDGDGAFAGV
jgi:hypothetical protein